MFIAITLRFEKINDREVFLINKNFKDIFDKLGVTLVPIFQNVNIKKLANLCDAVILTGSPLHVNPKLYNKKEEINYDFSYSKEDDLDYTLIKEFDKLNKPILGICRGIQVINTYFGGTLHQNIKNHEKTTHKINILDNNFLNKIYQEKSMIVNSTHTQCIDKLAENFKICAISEDNVIEAIENKNIIAVQWHPEKLFDYDFFDYFINR